LPHASRQRRGARRHDAERAVRRSFARAAAEPSLTDIAENRLSAGGSDGFVVRLATE
jgi:hypothetical protein